MVRYKIFPYVAPFALFGNALCFGVVDHWRRWVYLVIAIGLVVYLLEVVRDWRALLRQYHPCRYCGRLNVEAEAARKIVVGEGPWPWPNPDTQTRLAKELVAEKMRRIELEAKVRAVLKLLQLQLAKPQNSTFIR